VKAAISRCVITRDYDLLLLDGEGKSLQTWILGFEDSRIEAVVILRGDISSAGRIAVKQNARTYEMHNHTIFFARWSLSLFHISLVALQASFSRSKRSKRVFARRARRGKLHKAAAGTFTSGTRSALARACAWRL
jgi:hypothetical protein